MLSKFYSDEQLEIELRVVSHGKIGDKKGKQLKDSDDEDDSIQDQLDEADNDSTLS
jgi:hypothetical protein